MKTFKLHVPVGLAFLVLINFSVLGVEPGHKDGKGPEGHQSGQADLVKKYDDAVVDFGKLNEVKIQDVSGNISAKPVFIKQVHAESFKNFAEALKAIRLQLEECAKKKDSSSRSLTLILDQFASSGFFVEDGNKLNELKAMSLIYGLKKYLKETDGKGIVEKGKADAFNKTSTDLFELVFGSYEAKKKEFEAKLNPNFVAIAGESLRTLLSSKYVTDLNETRSTMKDIDKAIKDASASCVEVAPAPGKTEEKDSTKKDNSNKDGKGAKTDESKEGKPQTFDTTPAFGGNADTKTDTGKPDGGKPDGGKPDGGKTGDIGTGDLPPPGRSDDDRIAGLQDVLNGLRDALAVQPQQVFPPSPPAAPANSSGEGAAPAPAPQTTPPTIPPLAESAHRGIPPQPNDGEDDEDEQNPYPIVPPAPTKEAQIIQGPPNNQLAATPPPAAKSEEPSWWTKWMTDMTKRMSEIASGAYGAAQNGVRNAFTMANRLSGRGAPTGRALPGALRGAPGPMAGVTADKGIVPGSRGTLPPSLTK